MAQNSKVSFKMNNVFRKIVAVVLFSVAPIASSYAALVTINMTADNIVGDGGLCFDASCTRGTDWLDLDANSMDNDGNWKIKDSLTLDLNAGTYYFAWKVNNSGSPSNGNPAGLLAEILWQGNANYSSDSWEIYDLSTGNFFENAVEYGANGGANIWTNVLGGAVAGISTDANWIYTSNNFSSADSSAWIRTSITVASAVPEPSIVALFGIGLLGLRVIGRKRKI